MAIDSAYDDDVSDVLEAMTELFEANTPTDNYFVQQAIQGGDRADILQALSEINQSESQFKDGVAALSAEPEETQGPFSSYRPARCRQTGYNVGSR